MELKKSKGGLGKGLGSFGLSGSFKDGHKSGYEMDITKIQPNPNQPRKRFTEEDMETLVGIDSSSWTHCTYCSSQSR